MCDSNHLQVEDHACMRSMLSDASDASNDSIDLTSLSVFLVLPRGIHAYLMMECIEYSLNRITQHYVE
jgi:hypothetical protein